MTTTDSNPFADLPEAMAPPIEINPSSLQHSFYDGPAILITDSGTTSGRAKVYFDLLPKPEFRFDFEPDQPPSLKDAWTNSSLGDAELDVGNATNKMRVRVWRTGKVYSGDVAGWVERLTELISSVVFLIINGPPIHGSVIRLGRSAYTGRVSATTEGLTVTVDRLETEKQDPRSLYQPTHVARCDFSTPVALDVALATGVDLFRTLSLMKCRWVGVVGPWLYGCAGEAIGYELDCTKVMRHGGSQSWCHELIREGFSQLFPVVRKSFADPDRRDALQTAFHWLIESEQCAAGVEGSLIVQQAALECLAWHEVVERRRLCSETGFKPLPANDKIRWLLSLHQIPANSRM